MSDTVVITGIACLCIGILIGLAIDDTVDAYKDRTNGKAPMPKFRLPRLPGRTLIVAAVVATLLFNLVAALLLIKTRIDTSRTAQQQATFTQCVASYEQNFSAAYRARLAASTDATNALDKVVMSVAAQDRDAFNDALAEYVALRQKAKASQQANPYPPLPDDYCGPVPQEAK